jgi:hypothetical protein
MPKRFPYYARLSAADKKTYRRSDEITTVPLPDVEALRALLPALEAALAAGKRPTVAKAANAFGEKLLRSLGVEVVKIRVREVRPDLGGAELHGQYTYATEGETPVIEIWMRTGAREQVVKFRTFLRTLLHELAHHLDVTLFGLPESFHTEGFFRRESSLLRQLVPPRERPAPKQAPPEKAVQLDLFDV